MKTREVIGKTGSREGQALIIIALAVGILLFAVLWVADVHHIVFTKDKTQNAGDAAALSAARWQASTLNFQGELNLMHAMALAAGNYDAASVITQTQARLAFTGPMTAVAAAQQGAKLNGMPVNDDFTAYVKDRAAIVRRQYAAQQGGIPEPYPNAWNEYAAMLDAIAADGVAAGIDN
ncbi:MAG: pilus assembly protein TadG-related protein, partial [Kiritimatiellaeota bacterium]|nr:pilus assembly protein TadG-related protein [Kiritimatiellota bacterium]